MIWYRTNTHAPWYDTSRVANEYMMFEEFQSYHIWYMITLKFLLQTHGSMRLSHTVSIHPRIEATPLKWIVWTQLGCDTRCDTSRYLWTYSLFIYFLDFNNRILENNNIFHIIIWCNLLFRKPFMKFHSFEESSGIFFAILWKDFCFSAIS